MLTPRKHLTKKELHKDPVMNKISQFTDYVQTNQQVILYGIVGLLVIIATSWGYMNYSKERDVESVNKLAAPERVYFSGDYREAIRRLEKYCAEYEGTVGGGMGTFYMANAYFNTDQYDFALQYFNQYLDDYADNELFVMSSLMGIAACYEGQNKYEEAAKQYEKAAGKFPSSHLAPESMIGAARCYRMVNQASNAKALYEKVTKEYPETSAARDAKNALDEIGA